MTQYSTKPYPHHSAVLHDNRRPPSNGESSNDFRSDVLAGLRGPQKHIPSKYLYDEQGSKLFEAICELEEYYLTRAESQIMAKYGEEMARCIGSQVTLVELGSGNSEKTRILLDSLNEPVAYLPVDISANALSVAAARIRNEFPTLSVHPLEGDFTEQIPLPPRIRSQKLCVYFPGSTIGNLETADAASLLDRIGKICGTKTRLLIGFDLQKESAILHRAYNDAEGVTARFTMNLLSRINRELDANFDLTRFRHLAFYNESLGRIEIYIESLTDQTVTVAGRRFRFQSGERLRTEYSHKYTTNSFAELASKSGLSIKKVWHDSNKYFAVAYLTSGRD